MTAAESQAITVLTDMFRQFMADNSNAHAEIKGLITDLERRLCKKIEDQGVDVQALASHCQEREAEIDALLAKRAEMFEGEIRDAKLAAVAEAKQPGLVLQATSVVGRRFWRVVLGLAVVLGIVSTILLLVERFGSIG